MRITGGFLLPEKMHYTKPALTFEQQLDLLQQRGLTVADPVRALHWLQRISYYRLSAYCLPFKDGNAFHPGTSFDDIAGLYIFDRKLRLLVLDAIERIEVAIKTAITYEIAHAYGPFGHTDPGNFAPEFDHPRFMGELEVEERRAQETFASHFRGKYTAEPHLPIWMTTELLSFGTVSKLYKTGLAPVLKQRIATAYGVDAQFLASWIHSLSYVRNVCAHHKRLWNRQFGIKPRFPSRSLRWPHMVPDNARIYGTLVVLRHMLTIASPRCHWRDRLFDVFDAHPTVALEPMKIPVDWRSRALWRD